MPTIPVYRNPEVDKPKSLNAPGLSLNAPDAAFGAGDAAALGNLGKAAQGVGNEGIQLLEALEKRRQDLQDKADRVSANRALNGVQDEAERLTAGVEGLRGEQVVVGGKLASEGHKAALAEVLNKARAGLSGKALEYFDTAVPDATRSYYSRAAKHSTSELRTAADAAEEGAIGKQFTTGTREFQNDFATGGATIDATSDKYHAYLLGKGVGKDAADFMRDDRRSKAYIEALRMKAATPGNAEASKQELQRLLDTNKVTPADADELMKSLSAASDTEKAQDSAVRALELFGEGTDPKYSENKLYEWFATEDGGGLKGETREKAKTILAGLIANKKEEIKAKKTALADEGTTLIIQGTLLSATPAQKLAAEHWFSMNMANLEATDQRTLKTLLYGPDPDKKSAAYATLEDSFLTGDYAGTGADGFKRGMALISRNNKGLDVGEGGSIVSLLERVTGYSASTATAELDHGLIAEFRGIADEAIRNGKPLTEQEIQRRMLEKNANRAEIGEVIRFAQKGGALGTISNDALVSAFNNLAPTKYKMAPNSRPKAKSLFSYFWNYVEQRVPVGDPDAGRAVDLNAISAEFWRAMNTPGERENSGISTGYGVDMTLAEAITMDASEGKHEKFFVDRDQVPADLRVEIEKDIAAYNKKNPMNRITDSTEDYYLKYYLIPQRGAR